MAFTGSEGDWITEKEAAKMTSDYQSANSGGVKGVFLGKEKLQALLDQQNSKGIRFYFGKNSAGDLRIVAVSADKMENDDLTKILDKGTPCPPYCGTANSLNS